MSEQQNEIKTNAKYNALSVAKYLFSLDKNREYFDNKKMENEITLFSVMRGNFRLNQMLYLLQILYYFEHKESLFEDNLYAWELGVVVYSVYTHFWSLYFNINGKSIKEIEDKETKKFIDSCFKYLKNIPDNVLQEFSYDDPARSSTWGRSSQPEIDFTDKENLEFYQRFRSRWLQEIRL